MRIACALLAACLATVAPAYAEIEKIAIPGDKGLKLYWWPKISAVDGWHQDEPYSFHYSAKAFAPDGFTFEDAESVIYAKALFKPRLPGIRSLDEYIAHDQGEFLAQDANIAVRDDAALSTASGQQLRSFIFFPKSGEGNWERTSYGEEGEFYLLFTLSARSREGFDAAAADYERFIAGYRE